MKMNKNVTLLYVDDEPINLTLFELNFQNKYKVLTAESGVDGLEKLDSEDDIIVVSAEIYVERTTQRAILLGHKGERIKKVGVEARLEMEKFFGKKRNKTSSSKPIPNPYPKENKCDNGYV